MIYIIYIISHIYDIYDIYHISKFYIYIYKTLQAFPVCKCLYMCLDTCNLKCEDALKNNKYTMKRKFSCPNFSILVQYL